MLTIVEKDGASIIVIENATPKENEILNQLKKYQHSVEAQTKSKRISKSEENTSAVKPKKSFNFDRFQNRKCAEGTFCRIAFFKNGKAIMDAEFPNTESNRESLNRLVLHYKDNNDITIKASAARFRQLKDSQFIFSEPSPIFSDDTITIDFEKTNEKIKISDLFSKYNRGGMKIV